MTDHPRPPSIRRVFVLATCALTLIIIWYNRLFNTTPPLTSTRTSSSSSSNTIISHNSNSPSTGTDIEPKTDLSSPHAPFISQPLHRLCTDLVSSNSTIPGLIFLCDENSGGPGNIRNYILTCIRYALEAGATGLQIPRIQTRSPIDKADLFRGNLEPLDHMFDTPHFVAAMRDACPHIELFPTGNLADIPSVAAKAAREGLSSLDRMVRRITPKHFGGTRAGCDERDPNRYTDRFGETFREWMDDLAVELDRPVTSWEEPALVRLSWGVLWDWPVFRDGAELAASFGGILRFREDVLDLADGVVRGVRELAASGPRKERGRGRGDGSEEGNHDEHHHHHARFLGIHLRTEEDALSQWPTYGNQSKGYFHEAEQRGFRDGVAYLASGSEAETRRFAKDARARLNLNVKSKFDLLRGRELEKLRSLTWDQQALVDFVVLLESDYFVGVSPSSFSINVALKRHLRKDGLHTRPWKVGSGDQRSWLVGRYYSYWDDWFFMYDGMWP